MSRLIKKITQKYTLTTISGLHIGGSSENVEIGGIDIPVIKVLKIKPPKSITEEQSSKYEMQPYIPGSSLKGKMRCLLEQIYGNDKVGGNDKIDDLFGNSENNKSSRLIVRDAYMTEESIEILQSSDDLDMRYTEGKWENSIDRITGTAKNPRQIERIPAGVQFEVVFSINIWSRDDETALMELLDDGIKALEADYLGGSGSRGYGQIKLEKVNCPNGNSYDVDFNEIFKKLTPNTENSEDSNNE